MGLATSRVVVIKNETNATVEIREEREGALPGYYGEIIKFPPQVGKEVAATKFSSKGIYSGRVSILNIFFDGKQTAASLSAPTLIHLSKLVFRCTHDASGAPQFTISVIRAKFFDPRRIGCFGCIGRGHEGRREETIATVTFPG